MHKNAIIISVLFFLLTQYGTVSGGGGQWKLLQNNIGITAMHMQLLHNDRVVIFDRTDFGRSNLSLPNQKCRNNPTELVVKTDCTAHSIEYNVLTNTFRPLFVQTDVWCSSGAVFPDGRLVQTGGFNDGERKVREFSPCNNEGCDWEEIGDELNVKRWYATNHILPDGRQIIVGGRKQFNFEFYPKKVDSTVFNLPFLAQTNDAGVENNLYPFVFLNVDGNLFIFANNRAILFNYKRNKIVKNYPTIPGGDPRSYPSTGSAVLLPLKNLELMDNIEAEVVVCGGAPSGSFSQAGEGNFLKGLNTCARIKITDPNPQWILETMPLARVMGDMTLLPNGNVLIINGAGSGVAGWENGRNPVLNPVLYRPDNMKGSRFETQNPSTIPRMYHSSAILLRDGRVLVGGSNPHVGYEFSGVQFPTELRLEAFYPSYLDEQFNNLRPKIISPTSTVVVSYGQDLVVRIQNKAKLATNLVSVTIIAPSFATHSFSMNHRLLVLGNQKVTAIGSSTYDVQVTIPSSSNLAPSGYYMLFVIHQEIPSVGIWIKIK